MAATGKLTVRAVFADNSKSNITINDINPETGLNPDVRTIIRNFNNNDGGTLATKMKSKTGANWIGIDKATYTVTEREYIF